MDKIQRLINEALGGNIEDVQDHHNDEYPTEPPSEPSEPTKAFFNLFENANMPLYPGSKKHAMLSFIVHILQAKVIHGWSDNSVKTLLEIFEEAMSEDHFGLAIKAEIAQPTKEIKRIKVANQVESMVFLNGTFLFKPVKESCTTQTFMERKRIACHSLREVEAKIIIW
ncbi:hypothetical protein LINPERHAP2_LOCUS4494 [Linum perenne]